MTGRMLADALDRLIDRPWPEDAVVFDDQGAPLRGVYAQVGPAEEAIIIVSRFPSVDPTHGPPAAGDALRNSKPHAGFSAVPDDRAEVSDDFKVPAGE